MTNDRSRATQTRVYWLTEELFPPQVGGAELMAYYLTQGLAGCGFSVQAITRQPDRVCAPEEWVGTVRVRRMMPSGTIKGIGWRAAPMMLGYLFRLFTLLVREASHYDVVVISGMKIIPLAAVPACRLLGKKCIIRVESSFELVEPISAQSLGMMRATGKWALRAVQALQRAVVSRAHHVVAISEDIEQQLLKAGHPPSRIARIPNAIQLSRFHPVTEPEKDRLRERMSMPRNRTIALFAARLSRAKGIAMLIEAWPVLIARHPDLYLVIVGSGKGSFDDCEDHVARFIREHGLADHAVMVGQSDRVNEYLQAADLFIFPTDYEGFSLGLIEALASALPCAVTSVGAAPQLIREAENGFLFSPQDPQALIGSVEACLARRRDWPEVGRRARETVMPFDLAKVVQQYAVLCRSFNER